MKENYRLDFLYLSQKSWWFAKFAEFDILRWISPFFGLMHPHATFPDYQPQLVRPLTYSSWWTHPRLWTRMRFPWEEMSREIDGTPLPVALFHTTMKQHDLSCMTYRNWMDLPWILVIVFNIWRWNQTSNTDAKDLECFPEISVVLPQRGRIGRCFVFFSLCHFSFLQVSIDDVLGPKKTWSELLIANWFETTLSNPPWKIPTKTWQCLPQSTP